MSAARTKDFDECHKSLFVIKTPDNNCYYSIRNKLFGKNLLGKLFHRFAWLRAFFLTLHFSVWNFREKNNFWGILIDSRSHSFIATHCTRQKWFDDAQTKLIHLKIDRLAGRQSESSFPDFINRGKEKSFFFGLWIFYHHSPLLLRSRDLTNVFFMGLESAGNKILYCA